MYEYMQMAELDIEKRQATSATFLFPYGEILR